MTDIVKFTELVKNWKRAKIAVKCHCPSMDSAVCYMWSQDKTEEYAKNCKCQCHK